MLLTDAEKARILDWLLSTGQARPDRPPTMHKRIDKNALQSLLIFEAWDTPEKVLAAMKNAADKYNCNE